MKTIKAISGLEDLSYRFYEVPKPESLLMESEEDFPKIGEGGLFQTDLVSSGLAGVLLAAFNTHSPLLLRPSDIWCQIMVVLVQAQDKDPERFRSLFVSHAGKKCITIETLPMSFGDRLTSPMGLGRMISGTLNNMTPESASVLNPNFSGMSHVRQLTLGSLLLSSQKGYFTYGFCTSCGIPRIYLDGTPEDWENLVRKTEWVCDKILTHIHGETKSGLILRVVRKIAAERSATSPDIPFWRSIFAYESGSGFSRMGGWAQVFWPSAKPESGSFRRTARYGEPQLEIQPEWGPGVDAASLGTQSPYFEVTMDSQKFRVEPGIQAVGQRILVGPKKPGGSGETTTAVYTAAVMGMSWKEIEKGSKK